MIPKFRAWVKPDILSNHLNGVIAEALPNFIYGNCLVLREDLEEDKQFEEIIDFLDIELMQSTTLKDKNGVEIFEGDIVAVENHPFQRKEDSSAGMEIEGDYVVGWNQYDLTWCAGDLLLVRLKPYVRVIGNIYENSELLEVE
ncbi:hypothetical protein G3253_01295 [Enterococcus faecium]|uniref:YopX family protein n=1 Tax=Enterococcus faecium TaxID=1352 RepID=UPI0013CFAD9F|nr:YopX family protein [Enterococcus faecium]EGO9939004.1 hypothetical protein [Enterococcus faecium]NES32298.1 hypothetical protein [Enterococcus faecium]